MNNSGDSNVTAQLNVSLFFYDSQEVRLLSIKINQYSMKPLFFYKYKT
ncbi:hypothetical protein TrispH2_003543 [Trichoplax sp. H2]|nr:hypothetical protein TrispH2_003543 [Trichoplax sp. H2]|eukprot:RDD45533.1 hypothetical protein TrispH2_003543 [Trichoplax sp. H2]